VYSLRKKNKAELMPFKQLKKKTISLTMQPYNVLKIKTYSPTFVELKLHKLLLHIGVPISLLTAQHRMAACALSLKSFGENMYILFSFVQLYYSYYKIL
jgi:hypothetical protein